MKSLGRLLVVDDEIELQRALCEILAEQGYETTGAANAEAGLKLLQQREFDVVLSDLMMPGMDGIGLLKRTLADDSSQVVIIMTGQGTIPTAVEAMKSGAFDYVLKPFNLQTMAPILARAMETRRLRSENLRLRQYVERLAFESPRYRMIGSSPSFRRMAQMIEKVAPTDATVLIRGPSGTGKELVARALHHNSRRRTKPLVTINCAGFQESLLESELFGHEKGSFTGATQAKLGLIEMAEGGTLFIDEVAEMAPALQAKLLRVLEDGHYRRVGGVKESHANVRVVAATNRPLEEDQKSGRFREDLFYRLNVVTIDTPALADRREDIPALAEHFLATRALGNAQLRLEPEATSALMNHSWPGNVRELANVLERAQILAEGDLITLEDLPEAFQGAAPGPAETESAPASPYNLRALERRTTAAALQQAHGNKVQAAKLLGVGRRTLYRLIERHHLEDAEKKS